MSHIATAVFAVTTAIFAVTTAVYGVATSIFRAVLPGTRDPLFDLPSWLEWIPDERWLLVPLVLVGSYLLARAVHWWSRYRLDGRGEETPTFSQAVFAEIHSPLAISIGLMGIYLSLDLLGIVESRYVAPGLVLTVLTLVWARAAIRIGGHWISHVNQSGAEYEFAPMFKNLWTIGVVIGTATLLVSIWNLELTPFLASAGLLGIILGFAAQDAIGNLIGGVALYFDNTYKIGDVILLEDGMRGTVTDIGIRSTTVLTTDNVLVTVPNSVLNSTQVVNETAPERLVRIRVPLTAAYGTEYREVEQIVLDVCEDAPLIRESPRPRVLFDRFGDSALVFELRAYISHPLTEKRAVDQVNRRVYDAFTEAGITIPFPQRELSFLEGADDREFPDEFDVASADGSRTLTDRPHDGSDGVDDAVDVPDELDNSPE